MQTKLKCPLCGSIYYSGTMRPGDMGIEWEVGGMCWQSNHDRAKPKQVLSGAPLLWLARIG